MQVQSFELRLKVFHRNTVCCPRCQRPLDPATLLAGQQVLAATHSLPTVLAGSHAELDALARKTCERAGISIEEMGSRSHARSLVEVRRVFSTAARQAHFSFSEIGRYLGLHHTSVWNLVKRKPHRASRNGRRRVA